MTNKKVNLDGIEDPKFSDAYDSIIKYKQKLLFDKSFLDVSCSFTPKELKNNTEEEIENLLSKKAADYLIRYTDINKIENDESTIYNMKLMVMTLNEFKLMVDYFIKTLSDEQIQEIRKKTKRQQKKSEQI